MRDRYTCMRGWYAHSCQCRRRETLALRRSPAKVRTRAHGARNPLAPGAYAASVSSIFPVADPLAAFFAMVTRRTPLSKLADAWSASASGGS